MRKLEYGCSQISDEKSYFEQIQKHEFCLFLKIVLDISKGYIEDSHEA